MKPHLSASPVLSLGHLTGELRASGAAAAFTTVIDLSPQPLHAADARSHPPDARLGFACAESTVIPPRGPPARGLKGVRAMRLPSVRSGSAWPRCSRHARALHPQRSRDSRVPIRFIYWCQCKVTTPPGTRRISGGATEVRAHGVERLCMPCHPRISRLVLLAGDDNTTWSLCQPGLHVGLPRRANVFESGVPKWTGTPLMPRPIVRLVSRA